MGRRLENFFWRIWSNGHIHPNITGSQVAALFSKISEGNAIRNTPTQSPRSSRSLRDLEREYVATRYKSARDEDGPASLDEDSPLLEGRTSSASSAKFADSNFDPPQSSSESHGKGKQRDVTQPPPILKKPRTGSSIQIAKSARILTPAIKSSGRATDESYAVSPGDPVSVSSKTDSRAPGTRQTSLKWEQDEDDDDDDDDGSNDDREAALTLVAPPSRKIQERNSKLEEVATNRSSRKQSAYVASTGSNKHRPSNSRRKSSQSTSSNALKSASPGLTSQSNTTSRSPPPPLPLARTGQQDRTRLSGAKGRTVGRPSTNSARKPKSPELTARAPSGNPTILISSQSSTTPEQAVEEGSASSEDSEPRTFNDEEPPPNWLVDKDFRRKFVDKAHSASGPLRSVAPKSTVATMIPASFQASGKVSFAEQLPRSVKAKMKESSFTDEIVALKPPGEIYPAMTSEDSPSLVLPRTKSQLTLLLEKDKRKGVEKRSKEREGRGKRSSS